MKRRLVLEEVDEAEPRTNSRHLDSQTLPQKDEKSKKIKTELTETSETEALDEELRSKCKCNPYSHFTHAGPFVLGQQLSDAQFIDLDQFIARRAAPTDDHGQTGEDPNRYYMLKIVTLPWSKEEESYSQRQAKLLIYNEYSVLSMLRDQEGVIHHHGLYMDYFYDKESADTSKPSSSGPETKETGNSSESTTNPTKADAQEATQVKGMIVVGPTRIMQSHPESSSILAAKIRNSPLGVNWGKQKQTLTSEETTEQFKDSTTESTNTESSLPVNCPTRGRLMRRIILALDCYISHIYCSTVYPLPRLFSRFTTVNSEYENLQEYVKRYRFIPEMKTLLIMSRIADIVAELHRRNIAHRDLRLENILFNHRDEKVLLINFGLSRYVINDRICICDHRGSSAYISPDVLRRKPYNPKASDCWAMGIIFYTLLFGKFPFYAETFPELFKKINIGQYSLPSTVSVWAHAPEDQPAKTDTHTMVIYFKTGLLISRLIVTEAGKRLGATELRRRLFCLIREKVRAKERQETKRLVASGKVADEQLQVVPDIGHQNKDRSEEGDQQNVKTEEAVANQGTPVKEQEHLHDHNYHIDTDEEEGSEMEISTASSVQAVVPSSQNNNNTSASEQKTPQTPPASAISTSASSPSRSPSSSSSTSHNAFLLYLKALCLPTPPLLRSSRTDASPSVYSTKAERFYLRFGGGSGLSQYESVGQSSSSALEGRGTPKPYYTSLLQSEIMSSRSKRHKSNSFSSPGTSGVGDDSGGPSYLRSPTGFLRLGSKKSLAQSGAGSSSGVSGASASSSFNSSPSSKYSVVKIEGDVRPLNESEVNMAKSFLGSK